MSGYVYSDKEMLLASMLAYIDIPPSARIPGRESSCNVGELIDGIRAMYGVQNGDGSWSIRPEYANNKRCESMFSSANSFVEMAGDSDSWRSWNIVDSCNKNDSTGFCACMIDTGDGNAIVGFRGSEASSFYEGFMDWAVADFGMLNNALTMQQADAEAYLRDLWNRYGDRYNSFSLAGHSLGGNLAEHAAITAPDAMRNHIDHAVNLDGPGFSDEYLRTHRNDIREAAGTIDHYQWSSVGSLLFQPDGVRDRIINAHDDPGKEGTIMGWLMRHNLTNVEFDGDNFTDGELNILADILGPASRILDAGGALVFLWLPVVRDYILLKQLIGEISAIVDEVKRGIEDRKAEIKKFILNIYNYITGGSARCEFEIETSAVSSASDNLYRIYREVSRLAGEIASNGNAIPYFSAAGIYYKSHIRSLARGIEQDAERIRKCSDASEKAVEIYVVSDGLAADKYA